MDHKPSSPTLPPPPPPPSASKGDDNWKPSNTMPPPPPPRLAPPRQLPKVSSKKDPIPPPPPPPQRAYEPIDKITFMRSLVAENAKASGKPFKPCYMFFYGSLMDPEVIQSVIKLTELPTTKPATTSGFKIKMWGIYPALVPSQENDKVVGTRWECTEEDHLQRLAAYETSAYTWTECEAVLEDGTVIEGCRTFCWAGKPDSRELEEGSFDLERYQKYFKPSVTRKR